MEDLNLYNPEGSDLRKAQLRMLEIAREFDRICNNNGIPYWIMSGTLLGAKRHGGFIPWDDDFDVGVRYEDYGKLLICLEKELPENLKLQAKNSDSNFPFYFAKIRDLNSKIVENDSLHRSYKYTGLFIDIFPFESICLTKKWKLAFDVRYSKLQYEGKKGLFWKIVASFFFYLTSVLVPVLRFFGRFTKDRYSHGYGNFFYAPHKLSTCFPVGSIEFEGFVFNAPNDVNQYLIDEYGDYMEIPPANKRQIHSAEIKIFE
ncbi:LicD family protein [Flavobacterium sp. LHD-80]|uniref:LicD family protein n=1 Tax=Flavobacterium sp. LHD-80 TaxID=3071411 RepID=UPI0027E11E1B|nr:LicD family protein [Flavobacterium sp. LHD-80]MDQ6471035.1 LicD family protein [Flavobacterium sp. LHD-80]